MARVLVRRRPFQPSAKNVLRNADERRKSPIVQRVRKRVTGIEVHIFACRLVHLQRAAVIDRIAGETVAADQTGRVARNSTVIILAGRIARRGRPRRRAGGKPARNSLNRTKVAQCRAQEVVRGNKEVARTYGQPAGDFPINLEARLFRVRNGTVSIGVTVSDRSRSMNTGRDHLPRPKKIFGNLCRCRHTRYGNERECEQLIYCALRASAIRWQIGVRKNSWTLWIRDEQERESVAVVEEAETGPNDSLPVR